MYRVGIMQGRLTPPRDERIQFFPRDAWQEEFGLAARIGFDCIEWLYDLHDADVNPLASDAGIEEIKLVARRHKVPVVSLCAHCFVEKPLAGAGEQEMAELRELLDWLLHRANLLGMRRIVLPMEDASRLSDSAENARQVAWIGQALDLAEEADVEIDLETTLPPTRLAGFLDSCPHPLLKINYDIGNSAGRGYRLEEEFAAYGERIGGIHIKDKVLNGPTVPIGTGAADFGALARSLRRIDYNGDVILEAARGASGDEAAWAKRNRDFILRHLGSE